MEKEKVGPGKSCIEHESAEKKACNRRGRPADAVPRKPPKRDGEGQERGIGNAKRKEGREGGYPLAGQRGYLEVSIR
jgi:hypothetical protein